MNEWIDVKDRLPNSNNYKQYLIWIGYNEFAYYYNNMWVNDPDGFYHIFYPTHWMPLPKPPENYERIEI